MGRLFGLKAPAACSCRVLELGCGEGANTLSLAQALPGASFVGIDAAASAIARGSELARAAGLENVELRCCDIERLGDDLGDFDYVIAHGVYSWIPPSARGALLACCRERMSSAGVAYVSYNAYPGSYLRDMTRDMLHYHLRGVEDPHERLRGAQELMRTIVEIESPSPFAQVLREQAERMLRYSDALLFHDDLAEISTPFYFHEFVEHAERHGLRFLSEADLSESQMREVPPSAARLMATLPDDAVVREQYLDFFRNRMFRQTLLCHAEVSVRRELDDAQLERFAISSAVRPHRSEEQSASGQDGETFLTPEGFSITTSEPLVVAAMRELAQAWPAAVEFSTLLAVAHEAAGRETPVQLVVERLRTVLLQAYLARIVSLQGCALPLVAEAGERPLASGLARAQQAAGSTVVSSLLHANVKLQGNVELRLLGLLDGKRDRRELRRELADVTDEQLQDSLASFAASGLLSA